MNVRLRKTFAWSSGILYQGQFLINNYEAKIDMITASDDQQEQVIAYERIKSWMYEVLNGSVLIEDDDPKLASWVNTGARILILPEPPVDQILGLMLYSKLNAIVEDRLIITDIEISSVAGEGMSYLHSEDENVGPFMHVGWWSDPRPIWSFLRPSESDKIVALNRPLEWRDYDLSWEDPDEEHTNSVVFARFNRDEEK